ncbi:MAG: DNA primase [Bacillaceae bacterium G1]|nr:DNA primase [Bacillota bacterium]OJF16445.1 MAG: DNA primase [Bacillaceae bacterium G1]
MTPVIVVEGKNDRRQLEKVLRPGIPILCTYGIPSSERLEWLKKHIGMAPLYIFVDNDAAGRRIRGVLADAFPDAEHIYTRRGYDGVEGTPLDYLVQQLAKAGLEDWIRPDLLPDEWDSFRFDAFEE